MTAANDRNSRRGFGSMDQERQRSIASEGGRAAHQRGTAHEFSPEEARQHSELEANAVNSMSRFNASLFESVNNKIISISDGEFHCVRRELHDAAALDGRHLFASCKPPDGNSFSTFGRQE